MNQTKNIMIRVFHPVGQGAFYSERHFFNGSELTVVYDCGSTTLKEVELEKKIKSTFQKNHPIDILFISHFHKDHINGIKFLKKHCNIKNVVLPLLDADAKALIKSTNIIEDDYSDTELIENPNEFFGDNIQVITIKPVEISQNENGIDIENSIHYISEISKGSANSFSSGTVFKLSNKLNWIFIPFNYKQDERKEQFLNALKKHKLTLADIDTIEKVNENKKKIIEAYKEIDGKDLNENSMALFSGKQEEDRILCFQPCHYNHFHWLWRHHELRSGCLYLGDIDLTQPYIVRDLKTKLRPVFSYIGTLQIPHHGSIHNFDKSILDDTNNIECAIISYGTKNKYSHPSDRVISDIIANYSIYPYLVTEEQHSSITQWR